MTVNTHTTKGAVQVVPEIAQNISQYIARYSQEPTAKQLNMALHTKPMKEEGIEGELTPVKKY